MFDGGGLHVLVTRTGSKLWRIACAGYAVECALANVEGNEGRRAYVQGERWDERVKMASWWADELDDLKILTMQIGDAQ
ncbi:integrase arm-type DNA-binding domain-containing protein [Aliiruegeria sabulilitoris]|uniref:integrase arm-type DNA-binding domain-containing protein n=1 Tax=Aliiruegeria sabulilitoris TaxID=1510458 RepID=UPI00082B0435|nr:integrase arm-type DNA-binding domain-containing protein [Aliiruegeria sabulilitoris]NDR55386.1 hypothetical protein [Pseudoruegeria sp. M32A2M]